MNIETVFVHAGMDGAVTPRASSVPIFQTSTFPQSDPERLGTYGYSRGANPTRDALEAAIAQLENGKKGLAFASGMAAIASSLMLFKPGDHIVVCEDIYGGAFRILTTLFNQWGLVVEFVDATDPDVVGRAITSRTRGLYVESPSNPLLKITDLAAMAGLAKEKKLLSLVDNTFMTPYLQRPLEFGFDISIHSATKFIGGHSDLIAGLAVTGTEELGARLAQIQNAFGAILGPQDSWLTLRGIRTLGVRLDAQQKSAGILASWLDDRPEVERVHYPGLAAHPGRDVHFAQASGAGGGAFLRTQEPGKGQGLPPLGQASPARGKPGGGGEHTLLSGHHVPCGHAAG